MNDIKSTIDKDVTNWGQEASDELFEYGYSGLVGWLQNLGHKKIIQWKKEVMGENFLEIGIGQGGQFQDADLQESGYIGSDISFHNLTEYKQKYPFLDLVNADAASLPFASSSFDNLISIYSLEHIRNLDQCLEEINRIIVRNGTLLIALPAEGGFLYKLGRELTTKRYMEKNFDIDYDAVIRESHVNDYPTIIKKLKKRFELIKIKYLPFSFFPSFHLNAFICIRVRNIYR